MKINNTQQPVKENNNDFIPLQELIHAIKIAINKRVTKKPLIQNDKKR